MIIPIRCFTCGKVLADKWFAYEKEARAIDEAYEEMMVRENIRKYAMESGQTSSADNTKNEKHDNNDREKKEKDELPISHKKKYKNIEETYKKDILDKLGLNRYCCRRHMLGHVDMMTKI